MEWFFPFKNAILSFEKYLNDSISGFQRGDIFLRECLTQLPHLKCIKLGSVRSSHRPFKMHHIGYVLSSLTILMLVGSIATPKIKMNEEVPRTFDESTRTIFHYSQTK